VKAITFANYGPGTAIITNLTLKRGRRHATNIAELLELNTEVEILWNENTTYYAPYYMSPKSTEDAFRITVDRLTELGVTDVQSLLNEIEGQLDEIEITADYEDVFGTKFRLEE
jgi:16S rRNA U1498 N3-methylase RsmE